MMKVIWNTAEIINNKLDLFFILEVEKKIVAHLS